MKKWIVILSTILMMNPSYAQDQGIINNAESPHVKLKSINLGDCRWTSGFWANKFRLCEEVMVPHMGTILKGDIGNAYNNFKIVAGLKGFLISFLLTTYKHSSRLAPTTLCIFCNLTGVNVIHS